MRHREEECFYVLEGLFDFVVDGEEFSAEAGSLVYVPRGHLRAYENVGEEMGRLLATLAANLVGNDAPNTLTGTAQSDYLSGKGGGDDLAGKGAGDALYGGSDADRLRGGSGNDDPGTTIGPKVKGLYGNAGNDAIYGGTGADFIDSATKSGNDANLDEGKDNVYCGGGRDSVQANTFDIVVPDCERVQRIK